MVKKKDFVKQVEFIRKLRANKLATPNDFTKGMGDLIRQAREEKGITQAALAKALNRRAGTVSDIEHGNSEIGTLTLAQFAVELEKPISYFFPDSLLREHLVDVKSPFEYKMLEIAQWIEREGDTELTLNILRELQMHFDKDSNPDRYPPELNDGEQE